MAEVWVLSGNSAHADEIFSGVSTPDWVHIHWNAFIADGDLRVSADLVLVVGLPDPSPALDLLRRLKKHSFPGRIVTLLPRDLPQADLEVASSVADDFIVWPERPEVICHRVRRFLVSIAEMQDARESLITSLGKANLVGRDPAFLKMADKLVPSAGSSFPTLITGETGTGKDLFARAIHFLSQRRSQPFIPVDCAGIPDHLLENELFGHARGAYTDAHGEQRGLAALADKGTLFLDEIDSLSLGAQAKLLRFLQDHQFKPLGAERYFHSDIKIIAASNRNLEQAVADKQFRVDLYFRLNVLHIELPSLRDRPRDIPILAQHFLTIHQAGGMTKEMTPSALRRLTAYQWPGNIRELSNIIQRAIVFSQGPQINACDIALPEPATLVHPTAFRAARDQTIQSFEREYIQDLLRRNQGNITWAAREAGKERRAFGRLVKKYNAGHMPGAPGQF
jgi:DNA-binding NtrC family response regulator